jgi:hypothetical protein
MGCCGLLEKCFSNLEADKRKFVRLNDNIYDYNFKMVYGYYYAFDMLRKPNGFRIWLEYVSKLIFIFVLSFLLIIGQAGMALGLLGDLETKLKKAQGDMNTKVTDLG